MVPGITVLARGLRLCAVYVVITLLFAETSPAMGITEELHHLHSPAHSRQKRATDYFIDTLPVVDNKLYSIFLERTPNDPTATVAAIKRYMEQVLSTVNVRLATIPIQTQTTEPNNQPGIKITMIEPYIAKTPSESQFVENIKMSDVQNRESVNATLLLADFAIWLRQNQGILPHFDHAMLFTGYTLYGSDDKGHSFNYTQGVAYQSAVCQDSKSVSVVEEKGIYHSEYVVTHELAHSLGADHDGHDNQCPSSQRYIMADSYTYISAAANRYHPWQFSFCSAQAIMNHLNTLQANSPLGDCLLKGQGELLSVSTVNIKMGPNEVCRAFFGQESYACRGPGVPGVDRSCDSLSCLRPDGSNMCVRMQAPTSMCCGNKKACLMGRCVDSLPAAADCVMDEECPLGDEPGIIGNETGETCATLDSYHCYDKTLRAKCCDTCRNRKMDREGCEYGDKASLCDPQFCGTTTEQGHQYNFICCETCNNVQCTDTVIVNGTPCREFITKHGRHKCYDKQVSEGCCKSCEEARNTVKLDCPFGDNLGSYNCTKLQEYDRDCLGIEMDKCCDLCPKPPPTTTPRPTPTIQSESTPRPTSTTPAESTPNPGGNPNPNNGQIGDQRNGNEACCPVSTVILVAALLSPLL